MLMFLEKLKKILLVFVQVLYFIVDVFIIDLFFIAALVYLSLTGWFFWQNFGDPMLIYKRFIIYACVWNFVGIIIAFLGCFTDYYDDD